MRQAFHKGIVITTIILMDFLAGMEFDLFVPSFPELQSHFGLSPFWVETLLSINFAGYCLGLFFAGGLADRFGTKPIILLGLTIFIIGSIFCLGAPSYQLLVCGRFLQGIGVAAPAILSFLIIAESYSLKQQQYLMAILNGVMNASAGIAPVIGSYITLYFHWQGNFMTLLLLGLTVCLMTILFIPASEVPKHRETLSLRGYIPIFQSKPLMLLIIHFTFMFVPYWIFVGMSPLLYMEDLGVSLSHFGYYQGSLAFVFAFGSLFYGFAINRYDQGKMLVLSGFIWTIDLIMLALISFWDSRSPLVITLVFLPFCIGQIIPTTLLYPLSFMLKLYAPGKGSGFCNHARRAPCACGTRSSGCGLFLSGIVSPYRDDHLWIHFPCNHHSIFCPQKP